MHGAQRLVIGSVIGSDDAGFQDKEALRAATAHDSFSAAKVAEITRFESRASA